MTLKTPTNWSSNPDKSVVVTAYSDATVGYSSGTQAYSSDTVGLDEYDKLPVAWSKVTKNPVGWSNNVAATTNLYLYDSATITYDSPTRTYDGIVTGQDFNDMKTPTTWNEA